jgi:hypothetical protein
MTRAFPAANIVPPQLSRLSKTIPSTNTLRASSNCRRGRSPESAKALFSVVVGNAFNLTASMAPDRSQLGLPGAAGRTIEAAR